MPKNRREALDRIAEAEAELESKIAYLDEVCQKGEEFLFCGDVAGFEFYESNVIPMAKAAVASAKEALASARKALGRFCIDR